MVWKFWDPCRFVYFHIELSQMWIIYLKGITFRKKITTFASSCFFTKLNPPLADMILRAMCSVDLFCGFCTVSYHVVGAVQAGQQGYSLAGNLAGRLPQDKWAQMTSLRAQITWCPFCGAWLCLRSHSGWFPFWLGTQLPFLYLIPLFLICLPFPFCCCLQAKYISWKIPFSIRMCASPRKKYFSLQNRELENNSINSNCNTIATTDC